MPPAVCLEQFHSQAGPLSLGQCACCRSLIPSRPCLCVALLPPPPPLVQEAAFKRFLGERGHLFDIEQAGSAQRVCLHPGKQAHWLLSNHGWDIPLSLPC